MKKLPNVLICHSDGPGGVAHYYRVLSPYLPARFEHFIVHDPNEKRLAYKIGKLILRIPSFVKKGLRADIVCVNPSLCPRSYYRDMVFLLMAKMMGRKMVVFFRGWSLPFGASIARQGIRRMLFGMSYGRVDGFIVLGDLFREKLVSMGVPQENIFIETTVAETHPNFELPSERHFDASRKVLRLLFLSRIVDGKGWRQTIDFAKMLRDRLPDWDVSLTMAGDGDSRSDAGSYARQVGLDCHFPGRVHGRTKFSLYSQSDIFVMHSETEGLPNNILEAMAYGLLVVSTPVGAIPEIVRDGVNGILVQYGIEDSVTRLIAMLDKQGKIEEIMNRNMNLGRSRFLPKRCASRFMKIMDKMAGRGMSKHG